MKKIFPIFTLAIFMLACQNANEKKPSLTQEKWENADSFQIVTNVDTLDGNVIRTWKTYSISWSDSLLKMYIAFSDKELIKQSRNQEEYIFDQTIKTDTAVYDCYQIGHDVSDEGGANLRFITDQYVLLDTSKKVLYEYEGEEEKLHEWLPAEDYINFFYPVYELSPKTTAFVVSFSEDRDAKGRMDSLFHQLAQSDSLYMLDGVPKGCTMFDSSGAYRLLKSDKLEKEARKYFDREFYVYGTKGHVKAGIKDIVYGLDECRTNIFAFCFDKSSLKSIGHPVFCSNRLIDLTYSGKYSNIEKRLQSYHSQLPADYRDSMKTKIAGNVGDFYFTYNDDFLWGRKQESPKCYFPARCIYYVGKKETIISFDMHWLDLFGIPCD
jgi:hypothetical protein